MRNYSKILLAILFIFSWRLTSSQVNLDSLKSEFEKLPNDTSSVIKIGRYANSQKKINLSVATELYKIALAKAKSINNDELTCQTSLLLGSSYSQMSDFENASFYLAEAQKIAERTNNKTLLLKIVMTTGNLYSYNKQTSIAREIYEKGLKLCGDKPSGDKATILNNIGGLLYRESDLDPVKLRVASTYLLRSVEILEELHTEEEMISKYCNLGLVYCDMQNYDSALMFLNKAKLLIDKEKLPDDLITYYSYMGRIFTDKKDFENAEKYYLLSIEESKKLNSPEWIAEGYFSLSDMYDAKGDYKQSVEYFRKYHFLYDSTVNVTNFKAAADIQNKLEREKKQKELDSLKAEQTKNKIVNIALILISVLLVISGIMMYSRFKIKSESEKKLKVQNEIIGQKNKDITDSINYSRKIQDAILPSERNITELFPENFVYYKPKDIISGDFYWCAKVGGLKFFAVADCTGHGVPGALMSMLGTSLLKEIILTRNITHTDQILNELRKLVINALDQNSGNKDGMDISLICYDEKNKQLHFSGANNSAILISGSNLNELRPDKQPIGVYERMEDFTVKTVALSPDTTIYLYTDGFADQFGGPKGKKFKYRQLNELLISINAYTMAEQKSVLASHFDNWKSKLEQVDDVCIVGIKI